MRDDDLLQMWMNLTWITANQNCVRLRNWCGWILNNSTSCPPPKPICLRVVLSQPYIFCLFGPLSCVEALYACDFNRTLFCFVISLLSSCVPFFFFNRNPVYFVWLPLHKRIISSFYCDLFLYFSPFWLFMIF